MMKVWIVIYDSDTFPEQLYHRALLALDHDSVQRIRKFRKKEDACRCLIGRFLRCMVLHRRGIDPHTAVFRTTEAGKPYLSYPILHPPVAYNVAHDNAIVTITFSSNTHNPPAYSLGIDVMKVHLPGCKSFSAFVNVMEGVVTAENADEENLRRFFWVWTMKEAYTKAVGLGLGFDFRRVEYDAESNILRVDGARLSGWQFNKFVVKVRGDVYQGVIAQCTGGDQLEIIEGSTGPANYMEVYDAVHFVENTLQQMN
ncbi:hypothetical protein APHAL10511_002154 [Amanita phalloides]|nr:hypothetical protein APHAL10511_002154 [Amanita phalloides]